MSRKCDIRDNALSDNSALFMGVDEFLVVIFMFFWPVWVTSVAGDLQLTPFNNCEFR